MNIAIFDHYVITPLEQFGLKGFFWQIHADTVLYTWFAMAVLFIFSLILRFYVTRKTNLFMYSIEKITYALRTLCIESLGYFDYKHFIFIASLFTFTLACNILGAIFLKEPTTDLNTTIAISLASFLYLQCLIIKRRGIISYIKDFFSPIYPTFPLNVIFFPVNVCFFLPLNLIEKMSKIISMSFRLFGNILGGSVVFFLFIQFLANMRVYLVLAVPIILIGHRILTRFEQNKIENKEYPKLSMLQTLFKYGWMMLYALAAVQAFFSIFEGMIQAFVIAVLTLTYMAMIIDEEKSKEQLI